MENSYGQLTQTCVNSLVIGLFIRSWREGAVSAKRIKVEKFRVLVPLVNWLGGVSSHLERLTKIYTVPTWNRTDS